MAQIPHSDGERDLRAAATLISNGKVDQAKALLERFLDDHPDNPAALIQLGELLRHTPDIVSGIDHIRRGLQREPSSVVGWLSLASALTSMGQTEGSKAAFRQVLEFDEDRIEALNDLGTILMGEGDFESAIPLFQKASDLAPRNGGIRLNLARAFAQNGQTDEALEVANSLASLGQSDVDEASRFISEITRPISPDEMVSSLTNPHYNLKATILNPADRIITASFKPAAD